MANPFEDPDADYVVLVNEEGQYSLWPVFIEVPEGWESVFGKAGRQKCIDFIEHTWIDMRPKSLIAAMDRRISSPRRASSISNAAPNGGESCVL
jgi:MbtH protein